MHRLSLWGMAIALAALLALPAAAEAPATWQPGSGVTGSFTVLRAISGSTALAGGLEGALLRTTDGGANWVQAGTPTTASVTDLSSTDGQTIFILDLHATVERSTDAGTTWSTLTPAGGLHPLALVAFGDGGVLLVGRRSLLRSSDRGDTFVPATPGLAKGDAFNGADRAGSALVVYGARSLIVSADSAKSWRHLRLPVLARGDGLLRADFVGPRLGYVLTSFRRLFRTADAGHHWRELLAAGGAGADLAFSDSSHGLIAAPGFANRFDGYVLYTNDGGLSWRPQQVASRYLSSVGAAGSTGYAIANDGSSLFADRLGSERGRAMTIGFRPAPRVVRRGRVVRIRGRVRPAVTGAGVAVSMRSAGRWIVRFVRTGANGKFTAKFNPRRRAWFVAQLPASDGHGSAATKAVFVPVR